MLKCTYKCVEIVRQEVVFAHFYWFLIITYSIYPPQPHDILKARSGSITFLRGLYLIDIRENSVMANQI